MARRLGPWTFARLHAGWFAYNFLTRERVGPFASEVEARRNVSRGA